MCILGNFDVRAVNSTLAVLAPPFQAYAAKYGKLYPGKEKLIVENVAFVVPKASPLKARF